MNDRIERFVDKVDVLVDEWNRRAPVLNLLLADKKKLWQAGGWAGLNAAGTMGQTWFAIHVFTSLLGGGAGSMAVIANGLAFGAVKFGVVAPTGFFLREKVDEIADEGDMRLRDAIDEVLWAVQAFERDHDERIERTQRSANLETLANVVKNHLPHAGIHGLTILAAFAGTAFSMGASLAGLATTTALAATCGVIGKITLDHVREANKEMPTLQTKTAAVNENLDEIGTYEAKDYLRRMFTGERERIVLDVRKQNRQMKKESGRRYNRFRFLAAMWTEAAKYSLGGVGVAIAHHAGQNKYAVAAALSVDAMTSASLISESTLAIPAILDPLEKLSTELRKEPTVKNNINGRRLERDQSHKLTVDRVSVTYADGTQVLDSASFTAHPGEVTVLKGKNGAGKSTLMHLIQRLRDPTNGGISIDGYALRDYDLRSVRHCISYVPYKPYVFSGTLWENLQDANPHATPAQVHEVAEIVNFHWLKHNTLDTKINSSMSAGEQQRIELMRLLLQNLGQKRSLWLLDEPAANLQADGTMANVFAYGKAQDCTILVATHQPRTVALADQIVVLGDTAEATSSRRTERLFGADPFAYGSGMVNSGPLAVENMTMEKPVNKELFVDDFSLDRSRSL